MALKWFADNFMKLNGDNCDLVLGRRCDGLVTVEIGNAEIVNSSEEKLLGFHIDSKLSFKGNVSIHKDRVYPTCQVIHQNIGL